MNRIYTSPLKYFILNVNAIDDTYTLNLIHIVT
ncbi:hypothetical protein ACUW9N_000265 [Staphylococcus auricularis]